MRVCARCERDLSTDSFRIGRAVCKECNRKLSKTYPSSQPDYRKIQNKLNSSKKRQWEKDHREEINTRRNNKRHIAGERRPISTAKDTGVYLGVYIAENLISRLFEGSIRMPNNHVGWDIICKNGFKIDVKCACKSSRRAAIGWAFEIRENKLPDYFLCIAFDNRESLKPLHMWLIPGIDINQHDSIWITDSKIGIQNRSKYEKDTGKAIECCGIFKDRKEP